MLKHSIGDSVKLVFYFGLCLYKWDENFIKNFTFFDFKEIISI